MSLHEILIQAQTFIRGSADPVRYLNVGSVPFEFFSDKSRLIQKLEDWRVAFGEGLENPLLHNSDLQRRCRTLLVQQITALLQLAGILEAGETIYDTLDDQFAQLISLSTPQIPSIGSTQGSAIISRTFDTGFAFPLYWTALKCREPSLRQRALDLLSCLEVHEGAWRSRELAAVARAVIELEEDERSWSEDWPRVPEHLRVHGVSLDGGGPRTMARVDCIRQLNGPDGELDRSILEVEIPP